jgi:hypothetical protein
MCLYYCKSVKKAEHILTLIFCILDIFLLFLVFLRVFFPEKVLHYLMTDERRGRIIRLSALPCKCPELYKKHKQLLFESLIYYHICDSPTVQRPNS